MPTPSLATLRVTTIQTSRTPIHDHHGLGAALVAHAGRRREGGAVAGDGDVLGGVFHVVGKGALTPALFRRDGRGGHFSVFFLSAARRRGAFRRSGPCGRGSSRGRGSCRSEEHTSEIQSLMRTSYA